MNTSIATLGTLDNTKSRNLSTFKDYRNRLTSLTNATGTAIFAYDPSDERISMVSGGTTTSYPFPFYNVASSSSGTCAAQ